MYTLFTKLTWILVCVFLFAQNIRAQEQLEYSPIGNKILLSGNFGELRSNHFHNGLDIRTYARTNLPLYAWKKGQITEVGVFSKSYGKYVRIRHLDGTQSLYAHIRKFRDNIQKLVIQEQYNNKSYEVVLNLDSNDITVKGGELIAFSGNTGASGGPHLHFEIRDSSKNTLNPLIFSSYLNSLVEDHQAPMFKSLVFYPNKNETSEYKIFRVKKNKRTKEYKLSKTIKVSSENFGFGIYAYDISNRSYGRNGIYKYTMYTEYGDTLFAYKGDKIKQKDKIYSNHIMDYYLFRTKGIKVMKHFNWKYIDSCLKNIKINPWKKIENRATFIFKIEDVNRNISTLRVNVEKTKAKAKNKFTPNLFLKSPINDWKNKLALQRDNKSFQKFGNFVLKIDKNTVPIDYNFDIKFDSTRFCSQKPYTPLLKNIKVSYNTDGLLDKEKYYPAYSIYEKSKTYPFNFYREKNKIIFNAKVLGCYSIKKDIIKPYVEPMFSLRKTNRYKQLSFKIYDLQSGIKKWNAYVNNKWVLSEYEYKKNSITIERKNIRQIPAKTYRLKIVVEDFVGNISKYLIDIKYK